MVLSLDFQCKEDTMYKRMVRLMVDRTIYTGVKNTGIIHKHKVNHVTRSGMVTIAVPIGSMGSLC